MPEKMTLGYDTLRTQLVWISLQYQRQEGELSSAKKYGCFLQNSGRNTKAVVASSVITLASVYQPLTLLFVLDEALRLFTLKRCKLRKIFKLQRLASSSTVSKVC